MAVSVGSDFANSQQTTRLTGWDGTTELVLVADTERPLTFTGEAEESPIEYGSPSTEQFLLLIPLILQIIWTFAANVVVMVCVRLDKKLRSATMNLYVFSLAVADALVGLWVMPLMTVYTVYGYWPLGNSLCTFWINADFTFCTVSMLHLCLIASDRWQALSEPLKYNCPNRWKKTLQKIGCGWFLGLLVWVPPITAFRMIKEPEVNQCWFVPGEAFVMVQAVLVYYLPIVVMAYLYVRCLLGIRAQYAKINVIRVASYDGVSVAKEGEASMITAPTVMPESSTWQETDHPPSSYDNASTLTVPSTTTQPHGKMTVRSLRQTNKRRQQENLRGIRTLGVVMVTFLFCWLPFCTFWPIVTFCPTCIVAPRLYEYSYWSAYLNSAINPCLYFMSNRDFRRAFKTLLRRIYSK